MTSVLVRLVRATAGEGGVQRLLARAGLRRSPAYLEHTDNWVSLDEAIALMRAGAEITGEPSFAQRVGEQAVAQHAGTQVAGLLRSLGSPEAVLAGIAVTASKFSAVTDLVAVETRPGHAEITSTAREGFVRHPLMCDWTRGLLSQPAVLFGLPPARVEESECQARGGDACRYTVTWDEDLAAADLEERLTELEGQLKAMAARLDSAFATASDLVSPDDLATVLARIVERASSAVRAPHYVLAVRPREADDLHVFGHGLPEEAARDVAERALRGDFDASGAVLSAVVASSRRDYGLLIALHPNAAGFFPQEQRLLTLYARHAAAVLDMTTALEEAARRNHQVSALLTLAQQLAQGGTSEQTAERLASAVPAVVDCDRMSVWLWDADELCLRPTASWGLSDDEFERQSALTITLDDTPYLQAMIDRPGPLLVETGTEDALLAAILEGFSLAGLLVVPIFAGTEFLGVLNVGTVERPERLRLEADLLERLTGVAALAAPALQNARLLDRLRREATHDALTGLLNRAGFTETINTALIRAQSDRESAGLLFVDLDGFKLVNDVHGHDAGDELLRQVAARLRGAVRQSDAVTRLGGDEFAVVMVDATPPAVVAAVAARVRSAFEQPFRVGEADVRVAASVGEAIWPDDATGVEELMRRADARMYEHKAALSAVGPSPVAAPRTAAASG